MTTRLYLSTDVGAPVLNGLAGSEIDVLKGCLVTGYGSQAAAGWTEEFTATNVSVLRAPIGNRHYFRIADTFGAYASFFGYLTMTAAATGTGLVPGTYHHAKSTVADASPRAWVVVADEKTVWMVSQAGTDAGWGSAQLLGFGEFKKTRPEWNDFNSFIWAGNTTAPGGANCSITASNSATVALCTFKSLDGTQPLGTVRRRCGLHHSRTEGAYGGALSGHPTTVIPSASTGGILISPIACFSTTANYEEGYALLGVFPGIYESLHSRPLVHMDTINGTGELAGKTFLAVNLGTSISQVLFEISNTWS